MSEQACQSALEEIRRQVACLLPEAMERAVESYRAFVTLDPPPVPKGFRDHHLAGRSALAHLEALLKLARWATDDEAGLGHPDNPEAVAAMVGEAQRAVAACLKPRVETRAIGD